jgi:Tol biopolymer transport system component
MINKRLNLVSFVSKSLLSCLLITCAFADSEDDTSSEKNWDVKNPQGAMKTISIDTEETTWSNLSINPDGKSIVFDMLGDIYSVLIDGGNAVPLAQSFDWNMQPAFSPDGKTIAFVSDRDGASNLWVMDANGENARQLSHEKTALIHTPSWSPDGNYIAVTKGFMSSRSIPAGEIWMFHRAGGDGVQVTSRAYGPHTLKKI